MRKIFISYRRDDADSEAGRLFDHLEREFGKKSAFIDVDSLEKGRDFRKAIDESLASCGVLLSIIGTKWLDAKNDAGQRRLDDPDDFVRLETVTALKRDIPVIPVLVSGAKMPASHQLPDDLKNLAYRNGVELTHVRWTSDVQLLTETLRQFVDPKPPIGPAPPSPTLNWAKLKIPIVAALVIVAAAVAGYLYLLPKSVTVPDVRGANITDATSRLVSSHLAVGATSTRIDIQVRQGHWVIVDLVGKGGHVRTIPIPRWAKEKLDRWTSAATISTGRVFRAIRKNGKVWGDCINVNVVWHVVNRYRRSMGLEHVAPHDLRQAVPR